MVEHPWIALRFGVAGIVALLVSAAWSPDASAQGGSYGGGVISPGTPPITLVGNSGGPRDASGSYGSRCRGSIAMVPDHVFNVTTQMRVTFEVIQAGGDTTMVIVGPGGVICDDDGGNGTNPRIVRDLPPGVYQTFIGSYHQGRLHRYTLRVSPDHQRHRLSVGRPHRGTFAPGLPVEPGSGRPYVDFAVRIDQPGVYRIDLTSANGSSYDPYLTLIRRGRVVANDDDGAGYPNSRIERRLNRGRYIVRVSSFRRGQISRPTGFTLSVSPTFTPPHPRPGPRPHPHPGPRPHPHPGPAPHPNPGIPSVGIPGARVVVPNIPVNGVFTQGLPTDGENRAYMDYALTVVIPTRYTIELSSASPQNYDPYLRLMTVGGAELEHDDDGAGYPNSRITRHLNPGIYRVRVTSFRRGQISTPTPFILRVSQ